MWKVCLYRVFLYFIFHFYQCPLLSALYCSFWNTEFLLSVCCWKLFQPFVMAFSYLGKGFALLFAWTFTFFSFKKRENFAYCNGVGTSTVALLSLYAQGRELSGVNLCTVISASDKIKWTSLTFHSIVVSQTWHTNYHILSCFSVCNHVQILVALYNSMTVDGSLRTALAVN